MQLETRIGNRAAEGRFSLLVPITINNKRVTLLSYECSTEPMVGRSSGHYSRRPRIGPDSIVTEYCADRTGQHVRRSLTSVRAESHGNPDRIGIVSVAVDDLFASSRDEWPREMRDSHTSCSVLRSGIRPLCVCRRIQHGFTTDRDGGKVTNPEINTSYFVSWWFRVDSGSTDELKLPLIVRVDSYRSNRGQSASDQYTSPS